MKYPNANEYYHLTCNKNHEYTFYFTNGFAVKTKDNILMRKVVKGEMSFKKFIREFAHLIIDWPDRSRKQKRFKHLKQLQEYQENEHWKKVSEAIERADSEHCEALFSGNVAGQEVEVRR